MDNAEYTIVIVAGREFSVPLDTPTETIRASLVAAGYADVASAQVVPSTRDVGGVAYPTIEFRKQAGTKGLDGYDLVTLLSRVPISARSLTSDLTPAQSDLLTRLTAGQLTAAEALENIQDLLNALRSFQSDGRTEEELLCARFDTLAAVPAPVSEW